MTSLGPPHRHGPRAATTPASHAGATRSTRTDSADGSPVAAPAGDPRPADPAESGAREPAAREPVDTAAVAARVVIDWHQRIDRWTAATQRVRDATDAEAVHDLRVACRRLDAALRLWREAFDPRRRRRVRRRLRKLRRGAGTVRDAEVAAELLPKLAAEIPAPAGTLVAQLVRRCERRRAATIGALEHRVERERVRRLARRLERALEEVTPATVAAALARVERVAARARVALATALELGEDAALHAARLRVKTWRYAVEGLERVGLREAGAADRLRPLQSILGDLQDLAVLRERVERLERHAAEPERSDGEALRRAVANRRARRLVELRAPAIAALLEAER